MSQPGRVAGDGKYAVTGGMGNAPDICGKGRKNSISLRKEPFVFRQEPRSVLFRLPRRDIVELPHPLQDLLCENGIARYY